MDFHDILKTINFNVQILCSNFQGYELGFCTKTAIYLDLCICMIGICPVCIVLCYTYVISGNKITCIYTGIQVFH